MRSAVPTNARIALARLMVGSAGPLPDSGRGREKHMPGPAVTVDTGRPLVPGPT